MGLLLMVSLIVLHQYSRMTVKEEALKKASQTLEGTVQHIDNILLSVEQAAGNIYFGLLPHLDQPEMIDIYSRKLVESSSYIKGCAIAFKKGYFKDEELFMSYYFRTTDTLATDKDHTKGIVKSETFGNSPYTEQVWFTKPMETKQPEWLNPLEAMDIDMDPIITFCLPLPDSDGKPLGVIGVDVSLGLLTRIVLEAKPSENSYCTLLSEDGSFIVHPDTTKLFHQTVFTQTQKDADKTVKEAAQAMVSGQTGYKAFRMNGTNYYVFYKPFIRAAIPGRAIKDTKWSAGIIYPEDDIFGDYNNLTYYVIAIAIAGLLLLFLFSRTLIHRQLKPLLILSEKAQLIAKGNYNETIPDSRQKDEIGRLQNTFQHMQQSLAAHIGELELLTATLKERGEGLRNTYNQAQKADRMKTAFLHNMTNQMTAPSEKINNDVNTLVSYHIPPSTSVGSPEGTEKPALTLEQSQHITRLANDIQKNGEAITDLLNHLIRLSDEEMGIGKEVKHE